MRVKRLSECVSCERERWIMSRPMPSQSAGLIDFEALERMEDDDGKWFKDHRIRRWSDHVQSMTRKDLREVK